jgi:PAB1-binding protein PBP1
MRIARNIAVAAQPDLCPSKQNLGISRCIPVNASQPVSLQQLASQEPASVQDKYFSIPTLKVIISMDLRAIPQIALHPAVCQ